MGLVPFCLDGYIERNTAPGWVSADRIAVLPLRNPCRHYGLDCAQRKHPEGRGCPSIGGPAPQSVRKRTGNLKWETVNRAIFMCKPRRWGKIEWNGGRAGAHPVYSRVPECFHTFYELPTNNPPTHLPYILSSLFFFFNRSKIENQSRCHANLFLPDFVLVPRRHIPPYPYAFSNRPCCQS